jgi:hypothetical protein
VRYPLLFFFLILPLDAAPLTLGVINLNPYSSITIAIDGPLGQERYLKPWDDAQAPGNPLFQNDQGQLVFQGVGDYGGDTQTRWYVIEYGRGEGDYGQGDYDVDGGLWYIEDPLTVTELPNFEIPSGFCCYSAANRYRDALTSVEVRGLSDEGIIFGLMRFNLAFSEIEGTTSPGDTAWGPFEIVFSYDIATRTYVMPALGSQLARQVNSVPEPSTVLLLVAGLAALGWKKSGPLGVRNHTLDATCKQLTLI